MTEDACSSASEEAEAASNADGGEPQPSPRAPVAATCGHACDVGGTCCACVVRAPRPGLVPGLVAWWRGRGVGPPPLGTRGRELRFFCAACVAAGHAGELEANRWPLPFGGELLLRGEAAVEESVSPGDAAVVVVAASEEGSWVAVGTAGEKTAGSEGSWTMARRRL